MNLELTAHTTSGPVIHTQRVAGPEEAESVARTVLSEAFADWTPEHETGLRQAMQDVRRTGRHTSRSLVITLT